MRGGLHLLSLASPLQEEAWSRGAWAALEAGEGMDADSPPENPERNGGL